MSTAGDLQATPSNICRLIRATVGMGLEPIESRTAAGSGVAAAIVVISRGDRWYRVQVEDVTPVDEVEP